MLADALLLFRSEVSSSLLPPLLLLGLLRKKAREGGGGREMGLTKYISESMSRGGGRGDIFLRKAASRIENSFRVKGHCHAVKL